MARIQKSLEPVLDCEGHILNKTEMIKREEGRLKELVKEVAPEKLPLADSIAHSLAFQRVHLRELEEILTLKGFTEEYQNGANQSGIKESSESRSYNNLAKTYVSYQKQMTEILLKNASKEEKDELMSFLSGS